MNLKGLKEECFEANLLLPEYKLIDLTFGNVSVIDRAAGVFAIKPSGVDYETMTPDDMVVLDLEGNAVEPDSGRPSSDTPTHLRLYQCFDDITAIVHTHSHCATSFAQACREIPCYGTTHADTFYGPVPLTRKLTAEEVNGEYEVATGDVIVERFREGNIEPVAVPAVLVASHGPFAWGPSGVKAVENALVLEVVARMAMDTLALNPQIEPVDAYLLDKHYLRKHGKDAYYGQK